MQTNVIYSIAKKEIMDNIRNKWIIIMSLMFAILTVVVSYFGSMISQGWQDLSLTIVAMMTFVQYLVPIIALMLGYATIIGEIERGSMSALLSLSATRFEIVTGKFLGLASVLALTILIGFGIAGLIIAVNVSDVDFVAYLLFIAMTIMFGIIFLSISLFFSTVFRKRSSAIGGAVFLWFFFLFILQIIYQGILIASIGLEKLLSGAIPTWYYAVELTSPVSVYSYLVSLNVVSLDTLAQLSGSTVTYPSFISNWVLFPILCAWIIVFFVLAVWRFQRQDI
ncbi:MAG: ABC transporter permease subunit [Candidatus Thermoplasmatota archaeon]